MQHLQTNPMQVPELVEIFVENVVGHRDRGRLTLQARRSLASLARVSKMYSEIALRHLWLHLDGFKALEAKIVIDKWPPEHEGHPTDGCECTDVRVPCIHHVLWSDLPYGNPVARMGSTPRPLSPQDGPRSKHQ